MKTRTSDRRLAENEIVFRRYNESVKEGMDRLNELAAQEGSDFYDLGVDDPLHFYCECSDENCVERIKISPNEYNKIHENRRAFTIVCGHEVSKIEEAMRKEKGYCVVVKHQVPPETEATLHSTDVDNS